jgi:hypothetical protein
MQPYLLLALSGNAKARKCRLQRSCILALESRQKGKFWVRAKFAFLHKKRTINSRNFRKPEKSIKKFSTFPIYVQLLGI